MQASARATTQHCRQPFCRAPGPSSPHASSRLMASEWWWLLTPWCLLGAPWASSLQPSPTQIRAAGAALGQALWATVLTVKGAALGYPSRTSAPEMVQCVTQQGRADPEICPPAHQPGHVRTSWPFSALPCPSLLAKVPFQALGSWRALFYGLGEVAVSSLIPDPSSHLSLSQRHLFPLP